MAEQSMFKPLALTPARDIALPNVAEQVSPTPDPSPFPKYDVNIQGYMKDAGEQGLDMTQATNQLASELVEQAKVDPQFADLDVDWDAFSQENPNDIIRELVKNVRPAGDTGELVAEQFGRGLVTGAPAFYAGMKGMATGAKLGAPLGPTGILIGGATGFIGGSVLGGLTGDILYESLVPEEIREEQIAPEDQFVATIARTSGEFAPGLGLRAFTKPGTNFVAESTLKSLAKRSKVLKDGSGVVNRMNRIMNGTQQVSGKTLKFMERVNNSLADTRGRLSSYAGEAAAIEAAAVVGALAEQAKPGDPLYKAGGELLGGFSAALTPWQTVYDLSRKTVGGITGGARRMFSQTAREESAARQALTGAAQEKVAEGMSVEEAFQFMDDEIARMNSAVQQAEAEGRVIPSLAQLTDVNYLQKITAQIAANNSELSSQARASANEIIAKNVELLRAMYQSGDPTALQGYIKAHEEYFGNMLDALMSQESFKAMERLNNIRQPVEGISKDMTGEATFEALDRVFALARKEETALWDQVDHNLPASGSNLVEQYRRISDELIEGEAISPILRGLPEKLGDDFGTMDVPGLQQARTELQKISNNVAKILDSNPRASTAYENALEQLRKVTPEGNRDPRTMNLGLNDFDEKGSQAVQVAEYLERRLARLGPRGVDPTTRRNMEAALKLAQQRARRDDLSATVSSLTPEGVMPNPTTSGELIRYRSKMLKLAKQKAAQPNEAESAYHAAKLAEAALKDLEAMGVEDLSYDLARAFSRTLNDRFTRTIVGNVLGTRATGETKIFPELVTQKLFTGENTQVSLNIRQTEQAIKFLAERDPEQYAGIVDEALTTVRQQEDAFIRLSLNQIVDAGTGQVSSQKLNTFLNNDGVQAVLKNLPALRQDLSDLRGAQRLVDTMTGPRPTNESAKELLDMKAFAQKITGREDGPTALDSFIGTPDRRPNNPASDFEKLVDMVVTRNKQQPKIKAAIEEAETRVGSIARRIEEARAQQAPKRQITALEDELARAESRLDGARRRLATVPDEPQPTFLAEDRGMPIIAAEKPAGAGADAVNGLKETVLERAYTYATNAEGQFSANRFRNYLFQPLASGKDSVAVILRRKGVITKEELDHIKDSLDIIQSYSSSTAKYLGEAPDLIDPINDGVQALVRGFGARFGQKVLGGGPGPVGGLQAEYIGAGWSNRVFLLLPAAKKREVFVRMAKDPKFFMELYKKERDFVKARMIKDQVRSEKALDRVYDATANFLASTIGVRVTGPAIRGALPAFAEAELQDRAQQQQQETRPPMLPAEPAPAPAPPPRPAPGNFEIPEAIREFRRPPGGVAPAPAPTPTPPPQAAAPQAAPNPQQRSMYAALFPNDPVSGLARQQGIGSLMG
jgi:type II secretory pathway component PulJ